MNARAPSAAAMSTAILLALAAPIQPAIAQSMTFTPPTGVQCLSRPFTDASGASQTLTIYVLAAETQTYGANGFASDVCRGMSPTAYRSETCRIAQLGNDAVQNRLTQVLGARPIDLCNSAQRAVPFLASAGD
jgi:hypothetical protein